MGGPIGLSPPWRAGGGMRFDRHAVEQRQRLGDMLAKPGERVGGGSSRAKHGHQLLLWLARTGAPWRDLPPELMNWRSAWRRLQRWATAGVWSRVVEALRARRRAGKRTCSTAASS